MKTKKVRITIDGKYIDITIQYDDVQIDEIEDWDDDEMIIGAAFFMACDLGEIKVTVQDVDNVEQLGDRSNLH